MGHSKASKREHHEAIVGVAASRFREDGIEGVSVAELMRDAGFVDIVRIPYKWPINQWPRDERHKEIGEWTEANFVNGLESITLAMFTRFLGWTKSQVWDFITQVIVDWRDLRHHGYFDVYVTYGRKPIKA